MAETFDLQFDTADLVKRLEQLPQKVAKQVVIHALEESGAVMQAAIKQAVIDRSPKGEPYQVSPNGTSIIPGLLAEDIDVDPYISKSGLSANVAVGPTRLTAHVARWVNDGFVHIGGKHFPGTHFLEAGFDESAKEATNVFVSELADGIEKAFEK